MANERLRTAMANAQVDIDQIAEATRVDPKTVQRWLAGRVPHPRHRWKVSELVSQEEGYLWPTARPDVHRAPLPRRRLSPLTHTGPTSPPAHGMNSWPERAARLTSSVIRSCSYLSKP